MDHTTNHLQRLLQIMDELREKCPWDRKQDLHSLRQQTIEELYELTGAITEEDWAGIREELGDLLLHIVFYAKIASEQGKFTIREVIDSICDKLVARHPHIYGDLQVENEEQVKQNWEKLKLKEGKVSVLGGVPQGLPALVKAMRLQEKARQVGFDWTAAAPVREKVAEELEELEQARAAGGATETEEEFGDLLFSLVNYARFIGVDPENALERSNRKFIRRFRRMEELARDEGRSVADMGLDSLDELWNRIKKEEASSC